MALPELTQLFGLMTLAGLTALGLIVAGFAVADKVMESRKDSSK